MFLKKNFFVNCNMVLWINKAFLFYAFCEITTLVAKPFQKFHNMVLYEITKSKHHTWNFSVNF